MTVPEPTVQVTRYSVKALPEGVADRDLFGITVEPRTEGWAVLRGEHRSLGADGTWSWGYRWKDGDREPATDEEWDDYHQGYAAWLGDHRFDEATAIKLAKEAAKHVRVSGWTVERVLADLEAGGGRG
jgi:hypothetical protein